MRKLIQINFTSTFLYRDCLKINHFSKILGHFPSDSVINFMGNDPISDTSFVVLKSQEFDEIPIGDPIPVLIATFFQYPDGSVECRSVGPWVSGVNTNKVLPFTSPSTYGSVTTNGSTTAVVSGVKILCVQPPSFHGFGGSGRIEIVEYINDSSTPSCSHEWGEYRGIFENYKYCKKCNEKGEKIDP